MSAPMPVSINLDVRGMGQSATLAIKDHCRSLRAAGRHIHDFGLGQSPFPVPESVVEALRISAREKDYLPVKGLPALCESVAEFHRRKDQIDARTEDVLVGPGSKELMFLLQLCFYGEIVLRSPCWVSYLPQARIVGRRISLIHTTYEAGWKLTAELLDRSFELTKDITRPRLLVMNYPSNPTGHSYTVAELKELAEVARRYGIIVLSDEIYGQLHYGGEHTSIARYYPERTIVSSGLSKWCGAGGWRLGTFTFPSDLNWLLETMAAVASETYTSVSAPIQHAAVHAFRCGVDIERYLWQVRRILRALADRCVVALRHARIQVQEPVGAFYVFLDFSTQTEILHRNHIQDGQSLCNRILDETGVALLPGSAFSRPRGELSARLAFVDFDGGRALAAGEVVPLDQPLPESFLDQWCANVVQGVDRLVDWLLALK